jgi:hypothetical protein
VVKDLGRGVERPDRRQPAADDTEVEGGDDEARHRSCEDGVTAGEHGGQHDPPAQRDDDVGGAPGDDRTASHGAGRVEYVAAREEGERRRRRAA